MTVMQLSAIVLSLATTVGWLNVRYFRLPTSVAMLGAGLLGAAALLAAQMVIGPFWGFNHVRSLVAQLDFSQTVLNYLLGFLVFASGLQVDLTNLQRLRVAVWTLASIGVIVSTLVVGFGLWAAAQALHTDLPLAWALTFGALISPTDPIAVVGALRTGAVSQRIGSVLEGEALFNDGVGFVAFSTMLTFALTGSAPHPLYASAHIVLEAGGGLIVGVVTARVVGAFLRRIDDYVVETTATVTLAVGVYVLAGLIHVSGPIAAAAAGLSVGRHGLKGGMSDQTRRYVEAFWEVVDQGLNALLFLLLGLQVFVLPFSVSEIGLWVVATVLTLAARMIVVLPWGAFLRIHNEEPGATLVLTLGGLRGAISLALALSIPHGPARNILLTTTFVVVAFSVIVQGLAFPRLAERVRKQR